MANTYKNIVITPNIGNTADPRIQFSGGNTTVNTDINLYVYPTSNGTLSFEGSAGQLFSITNDLSNLIFSVADVSGVPSVEVFANGLVSLIPLSGTVGIGKGTNVNTTINATAKYVYSTNTSHFQSNSVWSERYGEASSTHANDIISYVWGNTSQASNNLPFYSKVITQKYVDDQYWWGGGVNTTITSDLRIDSFVAVSNTSGNIVGYDFNQFVAATTTNNSVSNSVYQAQLQTGPYTSSLGVFGYEYTGANNVYKSASFNPASFGLNYQFTNSTSGANTLSGVSGLATETTSQIIIQSAKSGGVGRKGYIETKTDRDISSFILVRQSDASNNTWFANLYSATNYVSFSLVSNTVNTFVVNSTTLAISNTIGLQANGSLGTDGQVLTSNGTTVYWATATINTAAQYNWTNSHTWSAAANLAFGTTIQPDTRFYVNTYWSSDSSTYNIYVNSYDQNTSLTAIRNRYGIYSSLNNRSQQKSSDGLTTYNSNYRAVVGDVVSGSSSSGGNAFASETIGGNFRSYNYANGSGANGINAAYGTRNQVFSFGTGVILNAYGTQSQVQIGNTTATGNITTAYGVSSEVISNTAATIATGYLFYGQHLGSTTTNKFGLYITGESNNYLSGNLTVVSSVNTAILTTGTTFIANSTQVTVAVPVSANGSTGTAGHVLTSNGSTGSPYWTAAAGGGYYKGGSAAVGTLGSGGQNLFRVNANTLNYNTTIVAGENAQATGPIAVASGITLTIETGGRVSIV